MRYLLVVLLILTVSYGEALKIAAASNVQYPLRELIDMFKIRYPEAQIVVIISSSGKLTAQIERGAPYHLFMSADMKYPEYLYEKGLTVSKPQVYAEGVLVLWSMKNIPLKERGIKILLEDYIHKISIPNPVSAPYGREAVNAMKYYKIYKKVDKKLVYGESVAQSTQYVYKRLVDVGFTSKSVVVSMKNKGVWISVDKKAYTPIRQGVVLLKYGKDNMYAKEFIRFLLSKEGKKVLKKYGYQLDE